MVLRVVRAVARRWLRKDRENLNNPHEVNAPFRTFLIRVSEEEASDLDDGLIEEMGTVEERKRVAERRAERGLPANTSHPAGAQMEVDTNQTEKEKSTGDEPAKARSMEMNTGKQVEQAGSSQGASWWWW